MFLGGCPDCSFSSPLYDGAASMPCIAAAAVMEGSAGPDMQCWFGTVTLVFHRYGPTLAHETNL